MKILEKNLYGECNGDKRLTQRAASIGELLSVKYGQPLSKIFKTASDLKRGYEFFSNPKTNFEKLTQPYFKQTAQEINGFVKDVELAETKKRNARTATLEVRYCPVSISPPTRLKNQSSFNIYAVYAKEINTPENCESVEWMLLTTESVDDEQSATQILGWYTYRWRVEEYHKILKSGCKAESYRLAGESMSTMLGFLTVIAAQLLQMTYLHRNCPHLDASVVLTKVQMDVLIASSPPKFKKDIEFNVDWAIRAIARLGGYLEHRKNSAIGIQVLWRGWLELETLCQGWLLHQNLK